MLHRVILAAPRFVPTGLRRRLASSGTLSRLLTRSLSRVGRRPVVVAAGPLRGARLELDVASEKALWSGMHELPLQEALSRVAAPDQVAWDVGAHVGFFTLLLARRCASVLALEPHPLNADRLRRHVALNDAPVEVVQRAVAGRPGMVELQVGPSSGTHKLAEVDGPRWRDAASGERLQVEAVTLDGLLERHSPPNLVKLDVEGAELEVLRAAPRVLRHAATVVVETHSAELRRDVAGLLGDAGFVVEEVGSDHLLARRKP
jgi:FkbM family methyltransferase